MLMQILTFIQHELVNFSPLWSSQAVTFLFGLHLLAYVLVSPEKAPGRDDSH